MDYSSRIEHLENAVRRLAAEIAALRAELGQRSDPAVPPPSPPSAAAKTPEAAPPDWARKAIAAASRERTAPRTAVPRQRNLLHQLLDGKHTPSSSGDMESLVGKYGTVVLAAITIVMGFGAFLTWAVSHIVLEPPARVALGALGALAIGVVGLRLRRRGETRFGNILLGLSLALIHVVAWGAGPYLELIPPALGLALAGAASVALAVLALRADEQALFGVGVGGALLAPFSTSGGEGDALLLLAFGLVVLTSAMAVVRDRAWREVFRLIGLGGSAYALAGLDSTVGSPQWYRELAAPAFALLCAWSAAMLSGRYRDGLARAFLGIAALTLLVIAAGRSTPSAILVMAVLLTVTSYAVLRFSAEPVRGGIVLSALIPLAAVIAVLVAIPGGVDGRAAPWIALAWASGAALAARIDRPDQVGEHVMTAALMSAGAVVMVLDGEPVPTIVALAAHAVAVALVMRRLRRMEPGIALGATLGAISVGALILLLDRQAFAYRPFGTGASLAALAVVVAWAIAGRAAARTRYRQAPPVTHDRRALLSAAWAVAAFVWIRTELARAIAPDIATFLLISFYALSGVGAIFLGRVWRRPVVRRIGLALAIYAAIKALIQATEFGAIGLRVGSFLVVGGFLLAVAYWYRASGPNAAEASTP